jgi:hemolysin activation/secretion protein
LNFAAHFEVSGTQNKSAAEQSFLGGFGSVRGYPDGIERGTNRYYGNFELRHIGLRYEKVQFQFSSFVDIGKAGSSLEALESEPKKSYGVGLRVASPNVHRLMFRIDYGRSFDGKFEGISLGLNQYFQPYRPL